MRFNVVLLSHSTLEEQKALTIFRMQAIHGHTAHKNTAKTTAWKTVSLAIAHVYKITRSTSVYSCSLQSSLRNYFTATFQVMILTSAFMLLVCSASGNIVGNIGVLAAENSTSLSCSRENSSLIFCLDESCKYGKIYGDPLKCTDDGHVSVLDCYCITYADHNKVEVGMCIFNCMNHENKSIIDKVYHKVSNNVSMLTELACSQFNRQGTLCGQCKNGTFPLVYSFNLTCVSCPETTMNWVKYISVAFIPLTFFYFVVVLFKINIASSYLYGFVIYSQAITLPVMSRILVRAYKVLPRSMEIFGRTVSSLYGVWNLDFFRSFDLGICLRTNALLILSLDFGVALYPFLLMALSYMLVNLHDQNYRLLVVAWRPFNAFFSIFSKNWDIRTSLVDSFATFLLLSHVRLLSVAYDLLLPVLVYDLSSSGQTISYTRRLFYDATVTYFGKAHLPYAVMAIVVVIVFVILPALLFILYPLRCFQKLLNLLPARWHILHTFIDSFLGCYKDGTEPGTRDWRAFMSIFILGRGALYVLAFTVNSIYFVLGSIALILISFSLLFFQPFKVKFRHYSRITAIFLLLLALFYVAVSGMDLSSIKLHVMTPFFVMTIILLWSLPLLYISFLSFQWMLAHRKFGVELYRRWQAKRHGYQLL